MGFFDFFKRNTPSKDLVENNLRGKELEDSGDLDSAISLYEYNIKHRFDGSHPYNRLAIIYRKRKEYGNEIAVLKQAIDVFTNDVPLSRPDRDKKIEEFNDRLKKADELLQKKILSLTKKNNGTKKNNKTSIVKSDIATRKSIPGSVIDTDQRILASESYRQKIYKKYYSNYLEKPYISRDRELNTNWIADTDNWFSMTGQMRWIPKEMMTRFSDGLLPGHVYMLYWIDKIHRKKIPVYFEYEFGIDFEKEKLFLQENGYLDNNSQLTEKGRRAISNHYDVIVNKK